MNWTCLDTLSTDYDLMTSDRPLITHFDKEKDELDAYVLPISPRRIFVASLDYHEKLSFFLKKRPNESVKIMNMDIASHAEQLVFATRCGLEKFIGKYIRRQNADNKEIT